MKVINEIYVVQESCPQSTSSMRLIITIDDADSHIRIEFKGMRRSQMTRDGAMMQWTSRLLAIAIIPQKPPMDCHQKNMKISKRSRNRNLSDKCQQSCRRPFLPKSSRNYCTQRNISHGHGCDQQET